MAWCSRRSIGCAVSARGCGGLPAARSAGRKRPTSTRLSPRRVALGSETACDGSEKGRTSGACWRQPMCIVRPTSRPSHSGSPTWKRLPPDCRSSPHLQAVRLRSSTTRAASSSRQAMRRRSRVRSNRLIADAGIRATLGAGASARARQLCDPASQMRRLADALTAMQSAGAGA